ncbi:restriction endonuclease [Methanolobus sp. ZRKC4]|uniref:restriction endonuclease n=1 Tax=Methanolobus sp. ZRKC4 TaxID=3125787 RepID=UPI003247B9AE
MLAARREIIKRVTEFEDFSVCWDNDRAAARGLVAQVRDMVNVKDSFTKMKIEKDEEKRRRLEQQKKLGAEKQNKAIKLQSVKTELFSLFGQQNAQKRGKSLEKVLNDLFACYNISVRETFTIKGKCAEGIIEQIDGLIELEGHLYLVEMKWWNTPIGTADISQHLVRLFNRGGHARRFFISYSEFTEPAISNCRDALSAGAIIALSTLKEIVALLEEEGDLKIWLKRKVNAAIVDREPYFIAE